jgi:hypothetical protein
VFQRCGVTGDASFTGALQARDTPIQSGDELAQVGNDLFHCWIGPPCSIVDLHRTVVNHFPSIDSTDPAEIMSVRLGELNEKPDGERYC